MIQQDYDRFTLSPAASFFVPGLPQPAGSKRALPLGGKFGGRPIIVDANRKAKPWKDSVASYAMEHAPGDLIDGPVALRLTFTLPRPKGHYRAGDPVKGLKANAPRWHDKKPDAKKLARGTTDALTGIILRDDSQVVDDRALKLYGDRPGVLVEVWRIEAAAAAGGE